MDGCEIRESRTTVNDTMVATVTFVGIYREIIIPGFMAEFASMPRDLLAARDVDFQVSSNGGFVGFSFSTTRKAKTHPFYWGKVQGS